MHTTVSYSNAIHRHQVIDLWDAVFGYETAHNTPSIAIDKLRSNESVGSFYEWLGYALEQRVSMGKRVPANIPVV